MNNKIGKIMVLISLLIAPLFFNIKIEAVISSNAAVTYRSYVQTKGYLPWVADGQVSGITGQSLRLEAWMLSLGSNLTSGEYAGSTVSYRSYMGGSGWQNWRGMGVQSGDANKKIEMINIKLSGAVAEKYDIYYSVYTKAFGWQGWAKNGENAGTCNLNLYIEAIKVEIAPKGSENYSSSESYIHLNDGARITYMTYDNESGWSPLSMDGATTGNINNLNGISAFSINLNENLRDLGFLTYKTDIIDAGWGEWKNEGDVIINYNSTSTIQGISIKLNGKVERIFNIYYRTYVENIGWLNWSSNGNPAGTTGRNYRILAIEAVLANKDNLGFITTRNYVRYNPVILTNPINAPVVLQRPELPTGCEVASLAMMFNYMGENVSKLQLAKEIPYHAYNPDLGYVGSPYTTSGWTIYPPALMNIVKKYAGSAVNLTAKGTGALKSSIDKGKPVVVWVRMNGFNLHVVLLTGYNSSGFYYNDPWTGKKNNYVTNLTFSTAWNAWGQKAISY